MQRSIKQFQSSEDKPVAVTVFEGPAYLFIARANGLHGEWYAVSDSIAHASGAAVFAALTGEPDERGAACRQSFADALELGAGLYGVEVEDHIKPLTEREAAACKALEQMLADIAVCSRAALRPEGGVCPDCGNVGVKVGASGYETCERFVTCTSDEAR
jgi:hypothetical protein